MRFRIGALAAMLVAATQVAAQEIRGVVRDSTTGAPIAGAVALLLDAAGATLDRGLTNAEGVFGVGPSPTAHRIRVLRIGFRPTEVRLGGQPIDIRMSRVRTMLEAVKVSASACSRRPDRESAMAVYEQARAGLLAMVVARQKRGNFVVLRYDQTLQGTSDRIIRNVVRIDSSTRSAVSFSAALGAHDLVASGFGRQRSDGFEYLAPDADVLLDDRFAAGYCFHIAPPQRDRVGQIGLGFAAPRPERDRVDVEGVLWVDTTKRSLRDIEFRYLGLDPVLERYRPGGSIRFEEMGNGTVLITQWAMRLVGTTIALGHERNPRNGRIEDVERTGFGASIAGGELARARWPDGTSYTGSLGRLSLQATDSGGRPARARLRLVDTPFDRRTDSAGMLELGPLVPGPYELVIVDSLLQELDLTIPTAVRFNAARDSTHVASLVVPTAAGYIRRRCEDFGERPAARSGYLLARVMTPYGEPVGNFEYLVEKRPLNSRSTEAPLANGDVGTDGLFQVCSHRLEPDDHVTITLRRRGLQPIVVEQDITSNFTLVRITHQEP